MKLTLKLTLMAGVLLAAAAPFSGSAHAGNDDWSALLRDRGMEAGLAAVTAEAAEHPDDAELKKLAMEIRKAMQREQMFERETNPELQEKIGQALRPFYYRHDLMDQALALDSAVYQAKPDEKNALRLAETLLNMERDEEAAALLAAFDPADAGRNLRLCAAIAGARTGDVAMVEKYLAGMDFESYTPQELMLYGMAMASLGDADQAAAAVAKMLAGAPAKENAMLRDYFQEGDFARVKDQPVFQAALETESQAGDSCAGCPNRGTSRCSGNDCD